MDEKTAADGQPTDYATLRRTMVERQVRTFEVTDHAIIGRMESLPREIFLPAAMAASAYSDRLLVVEAAGGAARAMLAPMVLARMIEAGRVTATDRALDLAGATGYSAALLAALCHEVLAVESDAAFTRAAEQNFTALGLANAKAATAPLDQPAAGTLFDFILVNGAVECGIELLFALLADRGRLVAIVQPERGERGQMPRAVLFEKANGLIGQRDLFDTAAPFLAPFRRAPAFTF